MEAGCRKSTGSDWKWRGGGVGLEVSCSISPRGSRFPRRPWTPESLRWQVLVLCKAGGSCQRARMATAFVHGPLLPGFCQRNHSYAGKETNAPQRTGLKHQLFQQEPRRQAALFCVHRLKLGNSARTAMVGKPNFGLGMVVARTRISQWHKPLFSEAWAVPRHDARCGLCDEGRTSEMKPHRIPTNSTPRHLSELVYVCVSVCGRDRRR